MTYEQVLQTTKGQKSYLVYGTTGEYSDRCEWFVAVSLNKDYAEQLAIRLNGLCEGVKRCYHWEKEFDELDEDSEWRKVGKELLELDPQFMVDYTGTKYYVDEIPLLDYTETGAFHGN